MNPKYGTITGYTQHDLETTFKEHLEGTDKDMVKRWYNGYNYFAEPIYNPFDILQFIDSDCTFDNYWWETGNPGFLIEILKKSNFYIPRLDNLIVSKETLSAFDVERIGLIALLWQTGYLTFDKVIVNEEKSYYKMKLPNREVQDSLYTLFFEYLTERTDNVSEELKIKTYLKDNNIEGVINIFKSLFSAIAYNNHVNNEIVNYEGYYASVIYAFLSSLGYDTVAEDVTNRGRIDLTLKTKTSIFIFEFKVDSTEDAIKQIRERKYYEKYLGDNKNIYIVGINFSSELKNISEFKWEKI